MAWNLYAVALDFSIGREIPHLLDSVGQAPQIARPTAVARSFAGVCQGAVQVSIGRLQLYLRLQHTDNLLGVAVLAQRLGYRQQRLRRHRGLCQNWLPAERGQLVGLATSVQQRHKLYQRSRVARTFCET